MAGEVVKRQGGQGQEKIHPIPRKLWEHPDPESTAMYRFMQEVNRNHGLDMKTFWDLYTFSTTQRSLFWTSALSFLPLLHTGSLPPGVPAVDESATIQDVPSWFPGISLNFAENILFSTVPGIKKDGDIAVTEVREGAGPGSTREITWGELRKRAGMMATSLKKRGLQRGDRVALVGANSVETLVVILGTVWLGGVFSSSSTDMGSQGILQRYGQVDAKFLFMDDTAVYNGKTLDLRDKLSTITSSLRTCSPSFQCAISISRFEGKPADVSRIPHVETWHTFLDLKSPTTTPPPPFEALPFSAPLLLCYSSGTTGVPKSIVHSVGGILLSYFKEGVLHEGAVPDDVALQYTTTGWIMYLANVGQLLVGARVVMYDGSPFYPDAGVLLRVVEKERVSKLGISPRWMFEVSKLGAETEGPKDLWDLKSLRVVTSTGMVLSEGLFEWFYDKGFPEHVCLANISGGTDIAGCFGLCNPLTPLYVGGTQGPSLGVPISIFCPLAAHGESSTPLPDGEAGELVATAPFPNIPVFLWNDGPPSPPQKPAAGPGSVYHNSYFARFANSVWAHGDFCVIHPVTKNVSFLGRADGVLNPSGVRFGSAEIYGVVERRFHDKVADSLCVGQKRPADGDERVLLFLLMRDGVKFTPGLGEEVKREVGRELSKRHVPFLVVETPEIPTTVNLKKVELPVKHIVSGKKIKPSGTLLNPDSLDYYYQFSELDYDTVDTGNKKLKAKL